MRGGRCQPAADQRVRAKTQVSGLSRRHCQVLRVFYRFRRVVARHAGPSRQRSAAGTTTTPVAVVATTGSSSISAADAGPVAAGPARPRRPRNSRVRERVPTRDQLGGHLEHVAGPHRARGTARRSTTRTAPRRRRCGCTPRWRRRRTGRGCRRRRPGCRRSARGSTARSGGASRVSPSRGSASLMRRPSSGS